MSFIDYDSTAASNKTIGGVSLQEGQTRQKDLNNISRQMMADIKAGVPTVAASVAVVQAWDFSASAGLIPSVIIVDAVGIFRYDSSDTTTAHNGTTVLVTTSGQRYKTFGSLSPKVPNSAASTQLTISSGSITPTGFAHTIETEGATSSDNLDTIVGTGYSAGNVILLSAASTDRTVVLKDGTGNLKLPSNADISLDDNEKAVLLRWDGTNWNHVAGGGAAGGSVSDTIPNAAAATELTIATGAVTPTRATHTIDTEADAASDDLATITATNFSAGNVLFISAISASRAVVVKHGTGNILLPNDRDITLSDTEITLALRYDGSNWNYLAGGGIVADPLVPNATTDTELTIATGAVVATQFFHTIDSEGDAASDDLDTITATNFESGFFLAVSAESASHAITLKHGTGNILLPDDTDILLDDTEKTILLRYDGANWNYVAGGGVGSGSVSATIPNSVTATELTIATGSVTPTRGTHTIDTESDAASDDLDTIVGTNFDAGNVLFISAENTARTVVVKHGTGNILLPSDTDISLDDDEKTLCLRWDGTNWIYQSGGGGVDASAVSAIVPNATSESELTISSGAVTPVRAAHTIDTESDAASDNLDTITGTNFAAGNVLTLSAEDTDRTVVLKHGTGNILHPQSRDVYLDDTNKTATLRYDGTSWHVVPPATEREFWIDDYGAYGDAVRLDDGVATASDQTFTCASANFTSADIGKVISIYRAVAAGANTYTTWHHTTIASINSTTSVELTAAPTASRSGTWFVYGTNDDAAKTAVVAAINSNGGGILRFTPGKTYLFGDQQDTFTAKSWGIIAYGAKIYAPAIENGPLVTSSDVNWLFATEGRAYEGEGDGSNTKLALSTTLSSAAAYGDTAIVVTSTTGVKKGQIVWCQSTEAFTSASSRGIFDINRVSYVDTANSRVYLEHEVGMDLSITAQTVTVKFYDALEDIFVMGGEWFAGGYAGDATAQGGGQSCFYIQYAHNVLCKDVHFNGWMGFPFFPQFCVNVVYEGGGHHGRPADIAYDDTGGAASGWYYGYSQQSRNVTMRRTYSSRCRHHIDGGFCIGLHAYDNDIFYSNTSALRTHNGVVDFDFSNNRLHHCYQISTNNGTRGRVCGNTGTYLAAGILCEQSTATFADNWPVEISDNDIVQVPGEDSLEGLGSSGGHGINWAGPHSSLKINRNRVTVLDDYSCIRVTPNGAGENHAYLEILDNDISSPDATTAPCMLIGNSAKVAATLGFVKGNRISAPSSDIIEVIGPSSGSLDDFYITDNYCPDATATATDFVNASGGNFGSNYYAGNNYGPAFNEPFPWTPFTPNISFNNVDVAAGSHSVQVGRYRTSGDTTEFTLHCRLSSAAAGSTGQFVRVEVPGLPSPAHDYAVSILTNAPSFVGVTITGWYSASTDDIRLYDGAGNILTWDDVDNDAYFSVFGTFVKA